MASPCNNYAIYASALFEVRPFLIQGSGSVCQIINLFSCICSLLVICETLRTFFVFQPLQDKRVVVGQNVVLECQVDGHPSPAIKWLKDGQNVTNSPDYEVKTKKNYFNSSCIIIQTWTVAWYNNRLATQFSTVRPTRG